jgi:hypothetical protein
MAVKQPEGKLAELILYHTVCCCCEAAKLTMSGTLFLFQHLTCCGRKATCHQLQGKAEHNQ